VKKEAPQKKLFEQDGLPAVLRQLRIFL